MQNVSFLIKREDQLKWSDVINCIEKEGFSLSYENNGSMDTVYLSGTFINPFATKGKKILLAHADEWGTAWDVIYKPVLEEYYDRIIDLKVTPLDKMMDEIRGELETSESRDKD